MTLHLFLTGLSVFLLDRFTKIVIYNKLSQGGPVEILSNIFHLTLVLNKGAAFGIFKGRGGFFIALSILAIFLIMVYTFKHGRKSALLASALGLILGGAIGNLLDRVRFGYVIDFLDFRVWPVFNIADSSITIGAFILVYDILFRQKLKGEK